MGSLSGVDNALGHFSPEIAVARECHDALEVILRYFEVVGESTNVPVVLPDRILEAVLAVVDRLRPFCRVLVAEDPTRVVLGLYDEDTVFADYDVVDLRGRSVRKGQVGVVENLILLWQSVAKPGGDDLLTSCAFARRRVESRHKDADDADEDDCEYQCAHLEIIVRTWSGDPSAVARRDILNREVRPPRRRGRSRMT